MHADAARARESYRAALRRLAAELQPGLREEQAPFQPQAAGAKPAPTGEIAFVTLVKIVTRAKGAGAAATVISHVLECRTVQEEIAGTIRDALTQADHRAAITSRSMVVKLATRSPRQESLQDRCSKRVRNKKKAALAKRRPRLPRHSCLE